MIVFPNQTKPNQTKPHYIASVLLILFLLFFNYIDAQTTLEWSPTQGCISFDDQEVEVVDNVIPIEDINLSECVTVCEGTPVDFWINDPNQTLSNITWTVNGGNIINTNGNQITASFSVNVGGPVSVNFEAFNQSGERITVSQCVRISYAPEALFELPNNQPIYCSGELPLINLSTTNGGSAIVSYQWHFSDDDTLSNAENPVHFFPEGLHTITLTVFNECGCSDTYSIEQEFNEGQQPVSCPTVVCENAVETYSFPNDQNCMVRRWSTNHGDILSSDSDPLVDVIWNNVPSDGFAVLRLETENCNCPYDQIIRIPVITETVDIEGEHLVCPNSQFLYKLPQWPSTLFNYSITDASGNAVLNTITRTDQHNEVIFDTSNLAAGDYFLNVEYENTLLQCGGQASKRIEVKEIWTIDGPEVGCVGTAIPFTETNNSNVTRSVTFSKVYSNGVYYGQTDANGFFTFTSPGIYELNNVGNPNECQSNSFDIEIIAAPSSQGLTIDGPDEICTDVPFSFSVSLPPDTGAFWSVTNGTIVGTAQSAVVQAQFDALSSGVTNYEITVQLYALDAPECLGDPLNILVPPLTVNAPILNVSPSPGNNTMFCTSSLASFTTNYANAERYDWSLSDPNAGSINTGQGTQSMDILWNELPSGVSSQIVDVALNVIECDQVVATTFYTITLLGTPSLSIAAPNEVCAEDFFSVLVTSTNNLPIDVTNATVTATLDGMNQTNLTVSQGSSPNEFSVNGLMSSNVDNNQNRNIVITVSQLNGCSSTVSVTGTILVKPTPRIFNFVQSGGIRFCTTNDINTVLEATAQSGSIGINSYDWYVLGNTTPIQSGTNPILDISSSSNPSFGSYYVVAMGVNGCTTQSESINVVQECVGNIGNGCGTQTANITLTWSDCDIVTATTPVGTGLSSFEWISTGFNEGTLLPGATATQAQFQVDGIGPLQIFVNHHYPTCTDINSERIDIEYVPQLDIEAFCNGTDFTVDLFNNSPYLQGFYPDDVTYEYSSNNGGSWTAIPAASTNASSATITNLPPADYLFRMRISSLPNSPACEDIQSLSLQLPNGSFTILDKDGNPTAETCVECPITLQIDNANPSFQYEWSWLTVRNLAETPSITVPVLTDLIELKITDPYGCSTTVSQTIRVNQANFEGSILASGNYCPDGQGLEISYQPDFGTPNPTDYQWLLNGFPAPGISDQATYTVSQSGVYSLELEDQNECKQLINGINMFVNTLPFAQIKMDDAVCVDALFDMVGYTQLPTPQQPLQYRWGIDQAFTSWMPVPANGKLLEADRLITTVGQAVITLEVRDPAGCETRETKTIEVLPEPTWVDVTATLEDCEQYTVSLNAVASASGNYYWSNGANIASTVVNHGGPYTVRFVPDGGGCPIEYTLQVPKHPTEFLWVFPSGCIEYCEADLANRYLIGPLGEQFAYEWQFNQQIVDTDMTDLVRNYEFNPDSGDTQFQLTTGEFDPQTAWCTAISTPLSLEVIEECERCEMEFSIEKVELVSSPYLHYDLVTSIYNPYGTSIVVQLYPIANVGIINPSSIVIPANSGINITLEFIPNGNFIGNSITIAASVVGEDVNCFSEVYEASLRGARNKVANLIISPNPAATMVQISLKDPLIDQVASALQIYTMSGIVVYSKSIEDNKQIFEVDVSAWIPGNYVVTWHSKDDSFEQEILIKK